MYVFFISASVVRRQLPLPLESAVSPPGVGVEALARRPPFVFLRFIESLEPLFVELDALRFFGPCVIAPGRTVILVRNSRRSSRRFVFQLLDLRRAVEAGAADPSDGAPGKSAVNIP
ncbi:MAG: hypothetical protein U0235_23490 [Polyangiaceae bacterium]